MQATASPFTAKSTASGAPNQAYYPNQWTQKELSFQLSAFSPAVQQFQAHQPASFSPQKPAFRHTQPGPVTVNVTLSPCKAANGGHVALVNGAPASVTINYCNVAPPQQFIAPPQPTQQSFSPRQQMPAGGAITAQQAPQFQSPSKVNPFYSMNINHAQGFVPVMPSHVTPVSTSCLSSPLKANQPSLDGFFEPFTASQEAQKTFVERSMYKREICKNWSETGFCRYGPKCQYAHGAEELSESHQLYMNEQKAGLNDKYKSQNCRQFYREKFCPYGKRCHFRHEYRSFKKIHRHFYQSQLAAFTFRYSAVLIDSKSAPDGVLPFSEEGSDASSDLSFEAGVKELAIGTKQSQNSTDVSTDSGSEQAQGEEFTPTIPESSRLSIFQSIVSQEEAFDKADKSEATSSALLKLMSVVEDEESWDHDNLVQSNFNAIVAE